MSIAVLGFEPVAIGTHPGRVPPPIRIPRVEPDPGSKHQRRTGDQFGREPNALATDLAIDVPAEVIYV